MTEVRSLSFDEMVKAVEEAQVALERANVAESAARSRTCECLNELSSRQKALDQAIAALKANAPRSSPWAEASRLKAEGR